MWLRKDTQMKGKTIISLRADSLPQYLYFQAEALGSLGPELLVTRSISYAAYHMLIITSQREVLTSLMLKSEQMAVRSK